MFRFIARFRSFYLIKIISVMTQMSLVIRSVWSKTAVRKKTEQTFWVIVIL